MTRLRLERLTKYYGSVAALDELTLEVEPGEFLVVVGPSGCGKSTLLRVIAGLDSVTGGDIYFDHERMTDQPPQQRDVGMVFQNYALYPHMTVAENLAFPLRVRKVPKAEREERVRRVALMLGLEGLLDRLPKQLSGGQQQRVAVGRALVRSPRVFLFDEPLSNLDVNLRAEMRTELATLQRQVGITTLYVTHDHIEAMTMGDRLAVVRGGRLVQVGTPEQLYRDPDDLFVATFLGTPTINTIAGVLRYTDTGAVAVSAPTAGVQIVLGAGRESLSPQQQAVTLAVRPEHVRVTGDTDADCRGIVERVEFIGHERLASIRVGGERVLMRLTDGTSIAAGETVGIRFDRSGVLLFGADGARLRLSSAC
jgi:ABC-type sugar transport system ATPase subunit